MTMITPSYLGETIEYSSLHACRSTLEDPTDRPEGEVSTMEVVASITECAEFIATCAPVGLAEQCLSARRVAIIPAPNSGINPPALRVPVGRIKSTSACIDIAVPRTGRRPSISIGAKDPDRQVIGDPVVNTDAHASGGEVVAFCAVIIINIYPVSPAVHPNAPAVSRTRYQGRRNNLFLPNLFAGRDWCWSRGNGRDKSR